MAKEKKIEKTEEPTEPMGVMFAVNRNKELYVLDVRPLTQEDADVYAFAKVQAKHFEMGEVSPDPVYWVPISAFVMCQVPGKKKLELEDLKSGGTCNCPICQLKRQFGLGGAGGFEIIGGPDHE